jgi:hypothetical protein
MNDNTENKMRNKMKKVILTLVILFQVSITNSQTSQNDMSGLKGPYLGQKPPGMKPEIFAPGIVSVDEAKYTTITFSSIGNELYFYRWDGSVARIYCCKVVNGIWTLPEEVSFTEGYKPMEPLITVDNKRIYFIWDKPVPAGEKETIFKIWFTERADNGWSEPQYAGQGMFVSTDRNGNLYVTDMSSVIIDGKTYLSKVKTSVGRFSSYEKQFIQPFSGVQAHPCIAPDGSYIIFDIDSGHHLFVSFKKSDGTWGTGIDLAENGFDIMAGGASITPDGKYLFFSCKGQLMWVDATIIEELRPKTLK